MWASLSFSRCREKSFNFSLLSFISPMVFLYGDCMVLRCIIWTHNLMSFIIKQLHFLSSAFSSWNEIIIWLFYRTRLHSFPFLSLVLYIQRHFLNDLIKSVNFINYLVVTPKFIPLIQRYLLRGTHLCVFV